MTPITAADVAALTSACAAAAIEFEIRVATVPTGYAVPGAAVAEAGN